MIVSHEQLLATSREPPGAADIITHYCILHSTERADLLSSKVNAECQTSIGTVIYL
jgi:hypothetical protein